MHNKTIDISYGIGRTFVQHIGDTQSHVLLNSVWPGGLGPFLIPYWRHQSLGYLKKIWMPVVNISWCQWTLRGFNIQILMLIIKC